MDVGGFGWWSWVAVSRARGHGETWQLSGGVIMFIVTLEGTVCNCKYVVPMTSRTGGVRQSTCTGA